jgi:hypothetical protein
VNAINFFFIENYVDTFLLYQKYIKFEANPIRSHWTAKCRLNVGQAMIPEWNALHYVHQLPLSLYVTCYFTLIYF